MTKPAKLIKGNMTIDSIVGFVTDETSEFFGFSSEFLVTVQVTPQPISTSTDSANPYFYNGLDVKVGDWIASSAGAIAVVITEIIESNIDFVKVKVLDQDKFNISSDPSQSYSAIGPEGSCVIFEVTESGFPVVSPMPSGWLDTSFQGDLISRFVYMGKFKSGGGTGGNTLETPTDGSLTDGAITGWQVAKTTYTDAIDDLNKIMGKLLPAQPPALSSKTLTISGGVNSRNGANILLAQGTPNNSGSTVAAGSQVIRVASLTPSTDVVTTFGSGNSGTLFAVVNGVDKGSIALTSADNSSTNQALTITADIDYPPSTPGFWQALSAKVSTTVTEGVNKFGMRHSETGAANPVTFVADSLTSAPVASNVTVIEKTPGTLFYSSGIPHYTTGAILSVSGDVTNLSGSTYLASGNVLISSSPSIGSSTVSCGQNVLPTILPQNISKQTLTPVDLTLNGSNIHTQSTVGIRGSNSHTDGALVSATTNILYINGTPTNGVVELSKSMNGVTLKRVAMASGSNPSTTVSSFSGSLFDSGNASSQGSASASHEAVIRGGVLRQDTTNYSTGYLPLGPDYSTKTSTQYATFAFSKVASSCTITFTGSDPSELWVKLPGISQSMPNATNGWWNAKTPYDFAPGQWPGSAGASSGCLLSKSGLTYSLTFGSASSAGSTDNMILIRVALTTGQSITNISVS